MISAPCWLSMLNFRQQGSSLGVVMMPKPGVNQWISESATARAVAGISAVASLNWRWKHTSGARIQITDYPSSSGDDEILGFGLPMPMPSTPGNHGVQMCASRTPDTLPAAPAASAIKDLPWWAGIKHFSLASLEILKPCYRHLPPTLQWEQLYNE